MFYFFIAVWPQLFAQGLTQNVRKKDHQLSSLSPNFQNSFFTLISLFAFFVTTRLCKTTFNSTPLNFVQHYESTRLLSSLLSELTTFWQKLNSKTFFFLSMHKLSTTDLVFIYIYTCQNHIFKWDYSWKATDGRPYRACTNNNLVVNTSNIDTMEFFSIKLVRSCTLYCCLAKQHHTDFHFLQTLFAQFRVRYSSDSTMNFVLYFNSELWQLNLRREILRKLKTKCYYIHQDL